MTEDGFAAREPDFERDWWNAIASDPKSRDANTFDPTIATAEECLAELLPETIKPGRYLDLGCGTGRLTNAFGAAHPDSTVVGVDICHYMLTEACTRRGDLANVEYGTTDGRTLPSPVGKLDGAWSMCVFQHLPADAVAGYVRQVADRLVTGGFFAFQFVPGTDHAFLNHHHDRDAIEGIVRGVGLNYYIGQMALYPGWDACWAWRR